MLWMKEEETVSIEACLIITPFGSPVVPLVYRMYWIESPGGNPVVVLLDHGVLVRNTIDLARRRRGSAHVFKMDHFDRLWNRLFERLQNSTGRRHIEENDAANERLSL